ncbi:MAG TPA: DMT family transporter [Oligoflexia bacterium]|nr:DMT family transporter [Oligoflexia bacterium]HMR23821.1 DMT family transporter [Oligoflexia bacterium]
MHFFKSGIFWNILSSLLFVVTSTYIKLASDEANHFQAVFFRSIIPIPILFAIAKHQGLSLWGTKRKLLFLRGLYGAIQLQFFIFAVMNLPLGDVMVLVSTSPLFVAFLSPWIAQEKSHSFVFWMIPLFLLGLSLIIKPNLSVALVPTASAISTAIGVAIISLVIRKLRKTDTPVTIVFYFVFFSSILSLPTAIYYWTPLSFKNWIYLCLSGISAMVAQICMTYALRLERASTLALFSYIGPVFGYIFGITIFNDRPDIWALLGASIIIACGIFTAKMNAKKSKFDLEQKA